MANAYQEMAKRTTGAAGSPAGKKKSPWILDWGRDLALFVATPALILPAFLLAREAGISIEDLALAVLAFGALGHHLPGMMRAYGDRELFQRFKWRFILAPIAIASVTVAFTIWELSAIVLAVYLWGAWHGLAQIYGFVRIYDAKVGSFLTRTKKLDFAMCVAWIGTGILWSPSRVYFLLDLYHVQIGGPLPPASVIHGIQILAAVATGIITVLFALNHLALWRAGQAPSLIKIVLMATAFGFWWYANFAFSNMIVGVALFEVFHDVQYLAIVWYFNRNRAERDPNCGSFTRFLFRRYKLLISLVVVAVYVGLVIAYGSLRYLERALPADVLKNALTGVLAASGLLHFYYDGFIWKVREKKTGEALGVQGIKETSPAPAPASALQALRARAPWLLHGAKWSLFLIPVAILGAIQPQARGAEKHFHRLSNLAVVLPHNPRIHEVLATAYMDNADPDNAIRHYELAIENGIKLPGVEHRLGDLYAGKGDIDAARRHYRRALELNDRAAQTIVNLGQLSAREKDWTTALRYADEAIAIDPDIAEAHANRGQALYNLRRFDEAKPALERALDLNAGLLTACGQLGAIAAIEGRHADAVVHYETLLHWEPGDRTAMIELGRSLAALGRLDDAAARFERAIAAGPRTPLAARAHVRFAEALEAAQQPGDALEHYRTALEILPRLPQAQQGVDRLSGGATGG
jgi:tetratricopeptide (TPR) repeat protein